MPASISATPELLPVHYQVLFERNPHALLVVACESCQVLAANRAAEHCFDYAAGCMLGLNLKVLFHPDDWPPILQALPTNPLEQMKRGYGRQRLERGDVRPVEWEAALLELSGVQACMLQIRDANPAIIRGPEVSHAPANPPLGRQDGFLQIDKDARFTFLNATAEELLRRQSADLVGRVIWDCFPEALQTDHHFHIMMALQGQWPSSYEVFYPLCQVRHEVHLNPNANGVSVLFRKANHSHDELARLNQEHDRLNAIVNASHDAIISTNTQGLIQTFSPGAEHIFGINGKDILGRSVDMLLPERFRESHGRFRQEFGRSPCPSGRMMGLSRVKGLRADGVEIDLEGSIANVLIEGQPVLMATLRDVSHSLAIDAEQKVMRKRLSQLTHRLMLQERDLVKRISLALHDQLGQTLAAVRLVHETITTRRAQVNPAEETRLFDHLGTLIEQSIRQVRVVLADLQPPMLDENGLAAALDNELRNRSLLHKELQLVLQAPPEVASIRWPAAVEYAAFMIAREAIENAIRHSGSSLLHISLAGSLSDLILEVWDNGCGYPAQAEAAVGHLGLTGITERANSIGAHLTLNYGDKGGAHLTLHWEAV